MVIDSFFSCVEYFTYVGRPDSHVHMVPSNTTFQVIILPIRLHFNQVDAVLTSEMVLISSAAVTRYLLATQLESDWLF